MRKLASLLVAALILAGGSSCIGPKNAKVLLSTSEGDIVVRLYDRTPRHRDNFLRLAKSGALDSTLFHRVIKDFMIQGGDPDSKGAPAGVLLGEGEVGKPIKAEIHYPEIYHKRGALAAARENDDVNPKRMSSGSQFYIVWGKNEKGTPHLNGKYTVFGEVLSGLEVVEKIQGVKTDDNDRPVEDVYLKKMKVVK